MNELVIIRINKMHLIKQLDKLVIGVMNVLADLIYPDKRQADLKRWQAWMLFLFLAVMI